MNAGLPLFALPVDGRVDVWCSLAEGCFDDELQARLLALLSPDEVVRARRFMFDQHRRLFTMAHALVRTALSRYADVPPEAWKFTFSPLGKPEIAHPPATGLRFNLSHTEGLAAVAIAGASREEDAHSRTLASHGIAARGIEVGIDVEDTARRSYELRLARRYFAPAEIAALELTPADEFSRRFLEFWTLKEAYLKATGKGLAAPLDEFAFHLSPGAPPHIELSDSIDAASLWQFAQFTLRGRWQGALALRGSPQLLAPRFFECIPLVSYRAGQMVECAAH